jgi:hypothetical protein
MATTSKAKAKPEAPAAPSKPTKKFEINLGGNHVKVRGGTSIYFVGAIGAVVYYISTATDFWMGALGILKSLVWPAFLVYSALSTLGG